MAGKPSFLERLDDGPATQFPIRAPGSRLNVVGRFKERQACEAKSGSQAEAEDFKLLVPFADRMQWQLYPHRRACDPRPILHPQVACPIEDLIDNVRYKVTATDIPRNQTSCRVEPWFLKL